MSAEETAVEEVENVEAPTQAVDLENDTAETEEESKALEILDPESGDVYTYETDSEGNNFLEFDGLRIYVDTLGGALKGIMFHYKQFTDLKKAVEMHGEEKVLDALNDSLLDGTRKKVKSAKIPNFDDEKAQAAAIKDILTNRPVQFTISEATNFKPGERDQTSGQIMAALKQAQKDGKGTQYVAGIMKKLMEVMAKENRRKGIDDGQIEADEQ